MTPKEKAVELYQKYELLGRDFTRGVSIKEHSKQCALIAVEEIIEVLSKDVNPLVNYWFLVKQEIEKL